jgi:alcohol dehydrogenase
MKAAVIYQHGGPGSIGYEAGFPDPAPAAGEVLVRVKAATLNYHDIFTRRGMPGIKIPMPCIMGLDFAGDIAGLGAGVGDWAVGDRVMIDPVDRVGGGGLIGEVRPGGLAEYCAVPAANLEKVLILGASGGVGTCCVQLAKLAGAEVIVCASSADKLGRLKDLGADHGIDYAREDFVKWVYSRFGKPHRRRFDGGVDVVVNFTGGETWVPSLKVLHRQGRILTCGATAGFDPKEDLRFIWTFELNIRGSNGWMREDLTALLDLIGAGKLKPVIDRELSLEDANEAFRLLEDRAVFGKVIVKP